MQENIITKEKINTLYKLYDELEVIKNEANEALIHAKSFGDMEVEVIRKDGRADKVKEKLLWDEIWILGNRSEGYAVLKQKYPAAFGKTEELNKKAKDIDTYSLRELGISTEKIKISDIIKLVEAIVDYKLDGNKTLQ